MSNCAWFAETHHDYPGRSDPDDFWYVGFMANAEHIELLLADVDEWNRWREAEPEVRPDLSGANLSTANLTMANLSQAGMRGVDFTMANLRGADLRGADLRGANFVGARLIGADFQGADLRGADLCTAEDLTEEQLELTVGDERTKIPDESLRPLRWRPEMTAR